MHLAKASGLLASSLLLMAPAGPSAAMLAADRDDVLLICEQQVDGGYLAGHAYVLEENVYAKRRPGWVRTRIPSGATLLVHDDLGFDILTSDPARSPASLRTLGARIMPLSNTDREIVILALHPGRMAMVYFFDLATLQFTLSVNRWHSSSNSAALLAGRCQSGH